MNSVKFFKTISYVKTSNVKQGSEVLRKDDIADTYSGTTANGVCKFGLKMVDENGNPIKGEIDYKDYIEQNGAFIRGNVNSVKNKAKNLLETLKPQYKAIAEKATKGSIVKEGGANPKLLDKIDFDGIYDKVINEILSVLPSEGGININVDSLIAKFSTTLEMRIEEASRNTNSATYTTLSDTISALENNPFWGTTANGTDTFGLKATDSSGNPVRGKIDYKDYIEQNGAYIRGNTQNIQEKVKTLLDTLKPQYEAIAQKAPANVITMPGTPKPSLLSKINFDEIYDKTVQEILDKIVSSGSNNINIDALVKTFSTTLEMRIEEASRGNSFVTYTKK